MSTRYIPPKTTLRQKKLQWINSICHLHDTNCDCPNPLEHTVGLLFEQEPELKFLPPERDLIKKCLTTTVTDTKEEDGDPDDIGEGDLDALFKEDFGEDATG